MVQEFDANRVRRFPDQPRKRFRNIEKLAGSIKVSGQKRAGIVFLVTDDSNYDAELIDGERRLLACRVAGCRFRAEVQPRPTTVDDQYVDSFIANFGGEPHDLMEIAHGLERLRNRGKTLSEMAAMTGKSEGWVCQHLSLLKLDPKVQDLLVDDGDDSTEGEKRKPLTFSLAQMLTSLPNDKQVQLGTRIVETQMGLAEARRLIVRVARDGGHRLGEGNKRGPKRQIRPLQTLLDEIKARIGIYIDMPSTELTTLINALDNKEKTGMVEGIDQVVEYLLTITGRIQDTLPKTVKKNAS